MNKGISRFLLGSQSLLALALLGALPGCSSDASPGSSAECSSFTACGGDLSGTWHVNAACLNDSANAQLEDAFKASLTAPTNQTSRSR